MENLVVKNVKLKWAHLAEPNTQGDYASGKYEVSVVLTPEQAEQVRGLINARQKIKTDKLFDINVGSIVNAAVDTFLDTDNDKIEQFAALFEKEEQ